MTLLKVSENDFQESPVNRAEMIHGVLYLLFNIDDIPAYKIRPDVKDCEFVLGYFCEMMLKEKKLTFTREYFLDELNNCCRGRFIDLEVHIVFDVLFANNILVKSQELFRFKFAYWVYYFLAQRMCHSKEFAEFILKDMYYTRFPEVIEFYTGIDRQREDALRILIQDIRASSDKVLERCGIPDGFNPYRLCKWQASAQMLEQMQDELSNGIQDSNFPESIKDSYADRQYDRTRPYNQEIRNFLSEYSFVVMNQAMKAGSRALRNSDYVDPEIKSLLLQEIMRCWEQVSKVLLILVPILAEEGQASFDGYNYKLRGNFGDTLAEKVKNILSAIPTNIVFFSQDDLFSQKMGPLLIGQLTNENNDLKKHILSLLLIHQRPRNWKKQLEIYIESIEADSFYLFDVSNNLRAQYQYSYASLQTLRELEYLIKLSFAKHKSGRKLPGLKQLKKVPQRQIPTRKHILNI